MCDFARHRSYAICDSLIDCRGVQMLLANAAFEFLGHMSTNRFTIAGAQWMIERKKSRTVYAWIKRFIARWRGPSAIASAQKEKIRQVVRQHARVFSTETMHIFNALKMRSVIW